MAGGGRPRAGGATLSCLLPTSFENTPSIKTPPKGRLCARFCMFGIRLKGLTFLRMGFVGLLVSHLEQCTLLYLSEDMMELN